MYPVVELRQYTLVPARREELIELFDRAFVEPQEAAGIAVLGQFRDLDDPDRFVWLRGFPDMPARAEALARFYGGPVWKAHRAQANATMINSDDVLLLRPVGPGQWPSGDSGAYLVTLYFRDRPFDELFDEEELVQEDGAAPLVCLRTLYAENTFAALPVRTGEHVFVRLARFPDVARLDEHLARWRDWTPPTVAGPPQHLRLTPTARSRLR